MLKGIIKKEAISGTVSIGISMLITLFLTAQPAALAEIISKDLPDREGVKAGELIVHSALKTGVQFDTNIYLTDTNEKYDMITLINPSVGFMLPLRDNSISMEYDLAYNIFDRFDGNNHADHKLNMLMDVNLTDYKITASDIYRRLTDRSGTEDINRIKRQTNDMRIGIATEMDQLAFDVSYTNRLEDFLSKSLVYGGPLTYNDYDSVTHILDVESSYRFLPKTFVLWDNLAGFIDYYRSTSPPDSYYIESLLGLRGDWFRNITLNLKAGARLQEYNSSSLLNDESYFNFVIRGGIKYALTEKDSINLNVEKGPYQSTYRNMNYYEVNVAGLDYTHTFRKVIASVFVSSQLNRYPEESTEGGETLKRQDKLNSIGAVLRYDMRKWISMEGKYEYINRNSKFSTFDYEENLITLSATIGF